MKDASDVAACFSHQSKESPEISHSSFKRCSRYSPDMEEDFVSLAFSLTLSFFPPVNSVRAAQTEPLGEAYVCSSEMW